MPRLSRLARYAWRPMGHEITLEVLNDLIPWMHETLPPKR
jgi:hypothetical protein